MEKIYIVTSSCYSDYRIEAVFKDRTKAEHYCTCHEDCEIEEYGFSDGKIFTPAESVVVNCNFYNAKDREDKITFTFKHLSKEDHEFYMENKNLVDVYSNDWANIRLYRRLPDNYDEEKIKQKYTKVFRDLQSGIHYMLTKSDCSSFDKRMVVAENIRNYIKGV